ncbi:MAG: Uma2 family endonuclease, partial [Methyloglobulus sp.]
YPDVTVDCSNPSGVDYFANSPVIIVEVLSKSTRKFDTSIKLLKYINIPTLKEYVLVEQDVVSIEVLRKSNEWRTEYYSLGDSITFEAIELTLTVEEIYDRVDNREINEFRQAKLDLENPGLTKS